MNSAVSDVPISGRAHPAAIGTSRMPPRAATASALWLALSSGEFPHHRREREQLDFRAALRE